MSRLRSRQSEVRILAGKGISPQNDPASIPWGKELFPRQQSGQSVKLTIAIYIRSSDVQAVMTTEMWLWFPCQNIIFVSQLNLKHEVRRKSEPAGQEWISTCSSPLKTSNFTFCSEVRHQITEIINSSYLAIKPFNFELGFFCGLLKIIINLRN
jgi:hypothetical protein